MRWLFKRRSSSKINDITQPGHIFLVMECCMLSLIYIHLHNFVAHLFFHCAVWTRGRRHNLRQCVHALHVRELDLNFLMINVIPSLIKFIVHSTWVFGCWIRKRIILKEEKARVQHWYTSSHIRTHMVLHLWVTKHMLVKMIKRLKQNMRHSTKHETSPAMMWY